MNAVLGVSIDVPRVPDVAPGTVRVTVAQVHGQTSAGLGDDLEVAGDRMEPHPVLGEIGQGGFAGPVTGQNDVVLDVRARLERAQNA